MRKLILALTITLFFPVIVHAEISVIGAGAVNAEPNIVRVNMGVTTTHANLNAALEQNTAAMNRLRTGLVQMGIAEEHITTTGFWVYRTFNWDAMGASEEVHGVDNMFIITLVDMNMLNNVIETAVSLGATNIHGVNFDTTNRADYYLQALALAIQDGNAKATAIARALNRPLGPLSSVVEEPGVIWGMPLRVAAEADGFGGPITPPTELTVSASIRMTFQ